MLNVNNAEQTLIKTTDLLKENGLGYWIDSGTLLGAYRDKNLIPYDHDLDIRLLPNQLPESKESEFIKRLWEIGYKVIIKNYGKRGEFICAHENTIMLD